MTTREERKWVTMREVAERAGVSKITVSRVLRDPGKVKPETRKRVQEAIAALGYVPDEAAGTLASRKSRIVGALISTLEGSIFASTVDGLSSRLRAGGYQLLLAATDYSKETEAEVVSALLGRRPDGLVTTSSQHTGETHALLAACGIPVVELWDLPEEPIDSAVGFSNFDAGFAMTQFLLERGARHIAFIGGRADRDTRSEMRAEGYISALRKRGGSEPRIARMPQLGASATTRGAEGLARILTLWPDTDAVFCSSDTVALGALSEARRRGNRVPEDIAIAGFGDFEFAGDHGLELTTVRIPGYDIGRRAAELILDRASGAPAPAATVDVGFEIVRRVTA